MLLSLRPAHRIRHWLKKAEPVSDLKKEKRKVKQLEKELYESNLELEILKALLKKAIDERRSVFHSKRIH
ncbi:MAG: hypothetical protein VX642_11830 [Bdellovibrionota bacterium]|nr:hypothetical protein [Bdellovibrionota bacterium]